MTENKEIFKEILKNDETWIERMQKLEFYGNVNKIDGRFLFKRCKLCNSPWISHNNTSDENKCDQIRSRGEKIEEKDVLCIENWIRSMPSFQIKLGEIDTRQRACYCDECDKVCKNRSAYENHLITEHGWKEDEPKMKISNST